MKYQYITIEGNIGAGKTTLAKELAKDFHAELVLEQFADNPFLPKFYKNPERNAFPLELFFMAERYQQLQETLQKDLFENNILLTDYLFSKSQLFAANNLSDHEFELYMRLFKIIYSQLPKPEIILYLHSSIPQLKLNIKKRGRPYEQEISDDYLQQIENAYFKHFRSIKQNSKILVIKADQVDFINREIDYLYIKKLLDKEYPNGIHIV